MTTCGTSCDERAGAATVVTTRAAGGALPLAAGTSGVLEAITDAGARMMLPHSTPRPALHSPHKSAGTVKTGAIRGTGCGASPRCQ